MSAASGMAVRTVQGSQLRRVTQRLAVFASLTLVVIAVMASLVLMQGIDRQLVDVTRPYEVRNQARELTLALTDAESSQLGYILTGDSRYQGIYNRASITIDARVNSLTAVTGEDPGQASRVREIVDDINQRVVQLEDSMNLATAQRSPEARVLIRTGINERSMDPARLSLEQFIAEEIPEPVLPMLFHQAPF